MGSSGENNLVWHKSEVFSYTIIPTIVKTAISDEESVTDAELLSSFLKVISREEKEILERNLEQIDEEKVDLLDVLQRTNVTHHLLKKISKN